eukprot:jgi/Psemu1/7825/gm1.7825_g
MPPARGGGHKPGASNYSQAKLLQLLNTIKELLPINKFPESDRNAQNLCRKYMNLLYCRQSPTGNPNFLEEVKLAKRIKKFIGDRVHVGNCGDGEFDWEEGCRNSNSSGEDDNLVDVSDDNIPPLRQPSQLTQPTQAEFNHMRTIIFTLVNITTLFADQLAPKANNKESNTNKAEKLSKYLAVDATAVDKGLIITRHEDVHKGGPAKMTKDYPWCSPISSTPFLPPFIFVLFLTV